MYRRVASLRAFQHRAYLTLWVGSFISNIGLWMQTVALGVFVTETTGRAGWTGTVAALMYFPAMVFGPLGGTIADRVDRRRYLIVGTLAQTLLAALLAALALAHRLTVPAVGVVALVAGCISAMIAPAFNALLAEIVPREDLLSAVSLNSAQYNLGRVFGPMLAAGVMVWGGVGAALAANAVSYFATVASVALVHVPNQALCVPEPTWAGIRRGIRVAHEDSGIRMALVLTLVIGILVAPFIGFVPVMAINLLGGGAAQTSALIASQGVGAVFAALVGGTIADRIGRRLLLVIAIFCMSLVAVGFWFTPNLSAGTVIIFALGATYLTSMAGLSTVIQSRAKSEVRARVSSLFGVLLGGGYALGLVAIGWLGDRFGIRLVGASCAGMCFILVAMVWLLRPAWLSSLDVP